jgi:hypothetical protein
LIANGRFQCLVAFGRRRKNIIFTSFHFSPHKILLKPFFPLILGFYFIMVLNHYFASFLPFPWPINYNHAYQSTKSSTHSLLNQFWLKIFSFPWIHGVAHDYILRASSHTNEWKTTPKFVFKFNDNPTLLWWQSWTTKGVPSFQSQTPSNLVLLNFFEPSYLSDFVACWSCFWWWIWNYMCWKHFNFCMVFNS